MWTNKQWCCSKLLLVLNDSIIHVQNIFTKVRLNVLDFWTGQNNIKNLLDIFFLNAFVHILHKQAQRHYLYSSYPLHNGQEIFNKTTKKSITFLLICWSNCSHLMTNKLCQITNVKTIHFRQKPTFHQSTEINMIYLLDFSICHILTYK